MKVCIIIDKHLTVLVGDGGVRSVRDMRDVYRAEAFTQHASVRCPHGMATEAVE